MHIAINLKCRVFKTIFYLYFYFAFSIFVYFYFSIYLFLPSLLKYKHEIQDVSIYSFNIQRSLQGTVISADGLIHNRFSQKKKKICIKRKFLTTKNGCKIPICFLFVQGRFTSTLWQNLHYVNFGEEAIRRFYFH